MTKEQIWDEVTAALDKLREEHGIHSLLVGGDAKSTKVALNGNGGEIVVSLASAMGQTEAIGALVKMAVAISK